MSARYINRERRATELGDPYFGCGEQDLIPRTVTSVLVWCAGNKISQRLLGLQSEKEEEQIFGDVFGFGEKGPNISCGKNYYVACCLSSG